MIEEAANTGRAIAVAIPGAVLHWGPTAAAFRRRGRRRSLRTFRIRVQYHFHRVSWVTMI
jgi:hypothetical protein